jgi:C-terminal processing protease CtpA/Prc
LWDANAEVVIIDLRNDPGGMTNVGSGLPSFLENMYYTRSNLKGVAVLMGLDTVSAGTILIAELEDRVRPILIGEPTGSSANMHLNAYKMALPHSKLQLEVSQDVYISVHEADPRAYIAPDIPMALSFENYANGRDPLIEAAKTVDEAQMEKMYNGANHNAPWMRTSQEKAIR